jgi:hypothetical protein
VEHEPRAQRARLGHEEDAVEVRRGRQRESHGLQKGAVGSGSGSTCGEAAGLE